tara:strand:- start:9194 stop:9493 length:300 start_codon:yes stop_codon:yes gene_type:complete
MKFCTEVTNVKKNYLRQPHVEIRIQLTNQQKVPFRLRYGQVDLNLFEIAHQVRIMCVAQESDHSLTGDVGLEKLADIIKVKRSHIGSPVWVKVDESFGC